MRILHVVASLDHSQGGPPRVVLGLGRALAELGHDVTILTRGTAGWAPEDFEIANGSSGSLQIVQPPSRAAMIGRGSKLLGEHDVAHFHGMWHPVGGVLQHRCIRRRRPYVLMPHGELDVWPMQQKRLKKMLHLAVAGRRLISGAAALHLLNDEELQGLRCLRLRGRYYILPNGLDEREWDACPVQGHFRRAHGIPADAVLIAFMARLHHKKAPDVLLEAFADVAARFPQATLVLAGPDYGMAEGLQRTVAARGLQGRVLLPGLVTGVDRLGLVNDADIFALPSHQEGHPMGVIEAAFMGKALLISPHCHCSELPPGEAAEVVSDDVAGVTGALVRLLDDEGYRRRLGDRAREIARERYLWSRIARELTEQYQTAVTDPQSFNQI